MKMPALVKIVVLGGSLAGILGSLLMIGFAAAYDAHRKDIIDRMPSTTELNLNNP